MPGKQSKKKLNVENYDILMLLKKIIKTQLKVY